MTVGLVFWILMLLWLVLSVISAPWPGRQPWPYWSHANTLFLFILFLLLGWGVFGAPIR